MADKTVFVFGSNLAGRHGKGAALHAKKYWNAEYGVGRGPTGNAYAIPTKDENIRTRPIVDIAEDVQDFLAYARDNQDTKFWVTAIGCGLAGYKPSEIAPLFKEVPENVILPEQFIMELFK
jgi:hypothetical protein